jgi:hypothetical protein
LKQLLLVLRGTPATIEGELDPVAGRSRRSAAEGTEERRIEVGDRRICVVEDRHAVRDDTVSRAERTTVVVGKTVVGAVRERLFPDG